MLVKVMEYLLVVLTGKFLIPLFDSHHPFYPAAIARWGCCLYLFSSFQSAFYCVLCIPARANWWSIECLGFLLIYYSQMIEVQCILDKTAAA